MHVHIRYRQVILLWACEHNLLSLPTVAWLAELFQTTGAGTDAALLNTVIIGAVNVASTVVAILAVDK